MRRYVVETTFFSIANQKGMQIITIYPESDNLDSVEKDIGILTARKGILRSKKNNQFKYKGIEG